MLCLNQDGDIPTDNRLDEVTLYQFACLHGHFRRDPRLTPLVVRQALKGFDLNAAEPNLKPGPILTGRRPVTISATSSRWLRLKASPITGFS